MIATLDELVAALGAATRQSIPVQKIGSSVVAHAVSSLWLAAGTPGPGAVPADIDGDLCSSETPGSLPLRAPRPGSDLQLARMALGSSSVQHIILYDRIWHGRVDLSTTAAQEIEWDHPAQRYADGAGVELYAEIMGTLGSTAPATWTAEIIDQHGDPGLATVDYGGSGSNVARRMHPFALPTSGVQRVESIQVSEVHPSGTLALVLLRRIVEVQIVMGGVAVVSSGIELGLPRIEAGACLGLMVRHSGTQAQGVVSGRLDVVDG